MNKSIQKALAGVSIPKKIKIYSIRLLYELLQDDESSYFFYCFQRAHNGPEFLLVTKSRIEGKIVMGSSVNLKSVKWADVSDVLPDDDGTVHEILYALTGSKTHVERNLRRLRVDYREKTLLTKSKCSIEAELLSHDAGHIHLEKKEIWKLKDDLDIIEYIRKRNSLLINKAGGQVYSHFKGYYFYPIDYDPGVITNCFPNQPVEDWALQCLLQNNIDEYLVNLALARVTYLPYSEENLVLISKFPWVMVVGPSGVAKSAIFSLTTGEVGVGQVNKTSSLLGYELTDKKNSHFGTLMYQGGHLVVDEFDRSKFSFDDLKQVAREGRMRVGVAKQHVLSTTTTLNFIGNLPIPDDGSECALYKEFEDLTCEKINDYMSIFGRTFLYIVPPGKVVRGKFEKRQEVGVLFDALRPIVAQAMVICLNDYRVDDLIEKEPLPDAHLTKLKGWVERSKGLIPSEISKAYVQIFRVINSIAFARCMLALSVEELSEVISSGSLSEPLYQKLRDAFGLWQDYFANGVCASISKLADAVHLEMPNKYRIELKQLMAKSDAAKLYMSSACMFLEIMERIANENRQVEKVENFDALGSYLVSTRAYHNDLLIYVCSAFRQSIIVDSNRGISMSTLQKGGSGYVATKVLETIGIATIPVKSENFDETFRPKSQKFSTYFESCWDIKNAHRVRAIKNMFFHEYPEFKSYIQPFYDHFLERLNVNLNLKDTINV